MKTLPSIRSFPLLLSLSLGLIQGCSSKKPAEPVREYKIEGEILKVNPADQSATIKHKDIQGWMSAMTMEYPIRSKDDMSRLHPGEHITGTVYVQGEEFSVGNIHAVPGP